jgi:hypothetical protein
VVREIDNERQQDRERRAFKIVCPCGRGEKVRGADVAAAMVRSHRAECGGWPYAQPAKRRDR